MRGIYFFFFFFFSALFLQFLRPQVLVGPEEMARIYFNLRFVYSLFRAFLYALVVLAQEKARNQIVLAQFLSATQPFCTIFSISTLVAWWVVGGEKFCDALLSQVNFICLLL